jgi:NAD(P)H dehydrogenase (quinone)
VSNASPAKRILVTGSTGATGTPTIKLLLERGFAVRAQVRRLDHRSETLASLGAEIVEGDLLKLSSVRQVLAGIHSAFFIFPMRPDLLDATSYFAQAAAEAELSAIVNLSQRTASDTSESHIARNHWMSERIFDEFPTPTVHLRPTFFADWFLYFTDMVKAGTLTFPFVTDRRHAAPTPLDRARVAAAILADPEPHKGQTYELFGAEELTFPEMTTAIGEALGKDIAYQQVPFNGFIDGAKAAGFNFDPYFIQAVAAVTKEHQAGLLAGNNDIVERIGGAHPSTIQEFIQANRNSFEA